MFDEQGNRTSGARMTAVVTLRSGEQGRHYRLPTDDDYAAVRLAQDRIAKVLEEWEQEGRKGLSPVPDEIISPNEIRRITVPIYGMERWVDLFTARQLAVLAELTQTISKTTEPIRNLLAVVLNRTVDGSASVSGWLASGEEVKHVFARQAIPIVWDFGESNYLSDASRSWNSAIDAVAKVVENGSFATRAAQALLADGTEHPLPDQSATIWFTDPPYYDSVPYAHLSDFFFVWLKRSIPDHHLLGNSLYSENGTTPKEREVVVDRPHRLSSSNKDAISYEAGMSKAFGEGRRILHDEGVGSVVFAHKTTEGWEALLSGMTKGGWTLTGSWPISTEMGSRLNARDTASLATSVHLVCRPRPEDAKTGEWSDVLRELPIRVGDWMQRLQKEGVRGADLVFACIGPALEIYSRYSAVETPDGSKVELPEYLERVWEVVAREALEQVLGTAEAQARNGAAGALEEDARLTALFLWTLQSTGDGVSYSNGAGVEGEET